MVIPTPTKSDGYFLDRKNVMRQILVPPEKWARNGNSDELARGLRRRGKGGALSVLHLM